MRGSVIWDAGRMRWPWGKWERRSGAPVSHDEQFAVLFGEFERRLASQDRRIASAESRSNTLIASSAVFAGLLVVTPMSFDVLVALVVNIAAAGFGIATIFPRPLRELSPSRVREQVLSRDPESARLYLSDRYLQLINDREAWIENRMRLVRAGLGLLGASLVLAAIAISRGI